LKIDTDKNFLKMHCQKYSGPIYSFMTRNLMLYDFGHIVTQLSSSYEFEQ